MSLLSNLMSFSSFNSQDTRQNRSMSVGGRFLFQEQTPKANRQHIEQKQTKRMQSRSLEKMNFYSANNKAKIDPKHRCLHRIVHTLSMKVRKQYFGLFVILETMKKNNQSLFKQKIDDKFESDTLILASNRLNQAFNILLLKQFQKQQKSQCFQIINRHSIENKSIGIINKVFQQNVLKQSYHQFIVYCKHIQSLEIKMDILVNTIECVIHKVNTRQNSEKEDIQYGLLILKTVFQQTQTKKQTKLIQTPPRRKSIQNSGKHEPSFSDIQEDKQYLKQQYNIVQKSEQKNKSGIKSSQKSQIKICKRVINLQSSIFTETINQDYKDASKGVEIQTNLNQCYFELDYNVQNMPKMVKKLLPQQLGLQEVGDLEDNSYIFRDYRANRNSRQKTDRTDKASVVSGIDHLDISDAVGQSFLRIQNMISDMQKFRDKQKSKNHDSFSNLSMSGVGGLPAILQDCSMIDIKDKLNDSAFGSDAVNFKNSLVMERESMHKLDKQKVSFLKKNKGAKKNTNSFQRPVQKQFSHSQKKSIKNDIWSSSKLRDNDQKDKLDKKNSYLQQDYLIRSGINNITESMNIQAYSRQSYIDFLGGKSFSNKNIVKQVEVTRSRQKCHKPQYLSEQKPKSFSFQYSKNLMINPNKAKANQQIQSYPQRDFDQRSDEGVKYLNFGYNAISSQPVFDKNWDIGHRQLLDRYCSQRNYPQQYLPVRDINVGSQQKQRIKNSSQNSSYQSSKQPEQRQRSSSFRNKLPIQFIKQHGQLTGICVKTSKNYNTYASQQQQQQQQNNNNNNNNKTSQKQTCYPPKKFINLIRK